MGVTSIVFPTASDLSVGCGGQVVEHQTFRSKGLVSKPGQFRSPNFACIFRKRLKAVGPFYLVSMPEEVKDPTQGVNV